MSSISFSWDSSLFEGLAPSRSGRDCCSSFQRRLVTRFRKKKLWEILHPRNRSGQVTKAAKAWHNLISMYRIQLLYSIMLYSALYMIFIRYYACLYNDWSVAITSVSDLILIELVIYSGSTYRKLIRPWHQPWNDWYPRLWSSTTSHSMFQGASQPLGDWVFKKCLEAFEGWRLASNTNIFEKTSI